MEFLENLPVGRIDSRDDGRFEFLNLFDGGEIVPVDKCQRQAGRGNEEHKGCKQQIEFCRET